MGTDRARVRLRTIAVHTPCRVSWDGMTGSDAVRHCGSCSSNVYNLSAMTEHDAEALLARAESVCIRYYYRPDGTLVTTNCGEVPRRAPSAAAAGIAATLATSAAFVGIQTIVDDPAAQTANVDGEHVRVAMGMKLTIKVKPSAGVKRRGHASKELQAAVSDASINLASASPAPRKAPLVGLLALLGLVLAFVRRRWWIGEGR
jgi:MYXO-CTERM domain-containing protein